MPDYLLLFLKRRDDQGNDFSQWRKEIFSERLDTKQLLLLDSDDTLGDGKKYRYMNVYRLHGPTDSLGDTRGFHGGGRKRFRSQSIDRTVSERKQKKLS